MHALISWEQCFSLDVSYSHLSQSNSSHMENCPSSRDTVHSQYVSVCCSPLWTYSSAHSSDAFWKTGQN